MSNTPMILSEDKLDAKLASLELRLVDRITQAIQVKADASHVEALDRRTTALERSRDSREHIIEDVTGHERRLAVVERELAQSGGVRDYRRWLIPMVATVIACAAWIPTITHLH